MAILVVVGLAVALLARRSPPPEATKSASSAAATPVPKALSSAVDARPAAATAAPTIDRDDRFDKLPDGTPVPPLPAAAPKTVGFGAILFAYRGAEYATKDAPSKQQAFDKAVGVLKLAQSDFAEAAKKGDRGSSADAGRIPQGVLERSVEFVLFSLAKGQVHPEPVDTPRGYWIVRRTE